MNHCCNQTTFIDSKYSSLTTTRVINSRAQGPPVVSLLLRGVTPPSRPMVITAARAKGDKERRLTPAKPQGHMSPPTLSRKALLDKQIGQSDWNSARGPIRPHARRRWSRPRDRRTNQRRYCPHNSLGRAPQGATFRPGPSHISLHVRIKSCCRNKTVLSGLPGLGSFTLAICPCWVVAV